MPEICRNQNFNLRHFFVRSVQTLYLLYKKNRTFGGAVLNGSFKLETTVDDHHSREPTVFGDIEQTNLDTIDVFGIVDKTPL